jgi:PAS domain S-box-containing protein
VQIDFEALLAGSPNPYVVLDPSLVIVWMNKAYLSATMREREDILGRTIFDAFPSDPASESYQLLKGSFDRVRQTRKADEIALIRYDIRNADGSMDLRYWSATHTPLLDQQGEVSLILQHTVDVTELQSLRVMRDEMGIVQRAQAVQARNRDLAAESERLRSLFEQAPGFVAILSGPDHVFQLANEAYRNLVGERDLAGKRVAEALPEVVDQGFVDLLTKVHDSGTAYVGRREKVVLHNERLARGSERYLDFLYQPIFTDGGQVSGIFVQGHDVTEQVTA